MRNVCANLEEVGANVEQPRRWAGGSWLCFRLLQCRIMPRFRRRTAVDPSPLGDPRSLFDDVFQPRHFFIGPTLSVTWQAAAEEDIPWETYQGRLLDARQTREHRAFVSWNLVEQTADGPAAAPLISLKWDAERQEVHVVRGLLCHAWEAADGGGNVIESRETTKWMMELVGTLALAEFTDVDELRDELICRLWQAVVGTSRLPLTSLEAPLPGFVLGQLANVYRPSPPTRDVVADAACVDHARATAADAGSVGYGAGPMHHWHELVEQAWLPELAWLEQAKLLECVLRAATPAEISEAAACCSERWKLLGHMPRDLVRLLKTVFNDVSLSPWTGFVGNALAFVQALVQHGEGAPAAEVDFLGWLLRQLSRHLTAYDLVTFHHRGANYPDALLLDAALKRLLQLAEQEPALFLGDGEDRVSLRRALRHGVVLRHTYEGRAVPDAPTSPGENTRVLPAPYVHVSEAQLLNPLRRERKLFADEPLAGLWTVVTKKIFEQSLDDLAQERELVELGMAIFIDRPLGLGKSRLEPDQTPLLAHQTHSVAILLRRLHELAKLASAAGCSFPDHCRALFDDPASLAYLQPGLQLSWFAASDRPVASLTDARRASDDFVVVRTLADSLREFLAYFDWEPLRRRFSIASLWQARRRWCGRVGVGGQLCMWLLAETNAGIRFEADPTWGYRCRRGVELPVAGLRILGVQEDDGQQHDLTCEELRIMPRW